MAKKPAKKASAGLTVLVDGAISDGNGGYHKKGDKIEAADGDSLKAKGLAE